MSATLLQDITFHNDTFEYDPSLMVAAASRGDDAPLPAPGYYRVKVVAGGLKINRETGKPQLDKAEQPIFTLQRIAVVEPEDAAGSFPLFQDIYTNGLQPRNWKTGEIIPGRPKTYQFMDLLTAIDPTAASGDYNENLRTLARLLDTNPMLTVRLTYEATDVTAAKAAIANGVDKKAAYKAARLNSQAFKNADGTYRTETMGPSGETVSAKLKIAEFVPETKAVVLGPLQPRG